jgi:hypothetical protein
MKLDDLDDAEQFQRVFVTPLTNAVREEVKRSHGEIKEDLQRSNRAAFARISTVVERLEQHDVRLKKVESNQKRAMVGYAGLVTVITISFGWVTTWVKDRLGF